MDKITRCIDEIVKVSITDLKMMTDIICDKYDIPLKDREAVSRGVLKEYIACGKMAVNVVDTLKELNHDN